MSMKRGRWTGFSNRVGLFVDKMGKVVLSFPYKDCILEAGMTKEEKRSNREERFFCGEMDEIEIDVLRDKKVLTNFSMMDKKGDKKCKGEKDAEFFDDNGNLKNNLLIKGNNLMSLYSLQEKFGGKVKMVYIDPIYNTGNDTFNYNDNFNHSSWLVFMQNRLEAARELLRDDGVIFISVDDNEQAYLKVLCDEIFDRENMIATFIWEKHKAPKSDNKYVTLNHEYVLMYSREKDLFSINKLPRSEKNLKSFSNPDNDKRGPWVSGPLLGPTFTKSMVFPIKKPNGEKVMPPDGKCWSFSKEGVERLMKDNRMWFGESGKNVPRIKRFLSELEDGIGPTSFLFHDEVGGTQRASNDLKKIFEGKKHFDYPKPHQLIQHLLRIATNENDIVLDFFAGSGTTGHATLALNAEDGGNRKFILCEQIDEHFDVCKKRLRKVLKNWKEWLGKDLNEKVVSFELKRYNQLYLDQIAKAKTKKELNDAYRDMQKNAFLQFWFEKKEFESNGYKKMTLAEQKTALRGILDLNQLYLNYPEMEDKTFKVAALDKQLTNKFYA